MFDKTLSAQLDQLTQQASEKVDGLSGVLDPVKTMIVEYFGPNGLIAAYVVLAVLVLFLVSMITRFTFNTLKYLVVPAIALAFVGSMVSAHSFVALLPVTVTVCSVFLLVKG